MNAQAKPDLTKPPSASELEAVAYQALRLPSAEESREYGLAHYLGTFTLERSDAALDAVVHLWTLQVRAALHVARVQAPPDWRANAEAYALPPEHVKCNFLRFEEYLDHVRNQSRAHPAPRPYAPYQPYATNVLDRFVASFNARRYTPDRKGYRRYLDDHAPENLKRFIKKRLPVCLPEEDRKLNSYIFASPGSGKSELLKLLVHAEVRKPGAAVVIAIDVAHDFAKQLRFQEFAQDDSRLVYIDPYLEYGYTPTINPFAVKGPFLNLHHEQHVKDRIAGQIYDVLKELLSRKEGGGFTAPMMPCESAAGLHADRRVSTLGRRRTDGSLLGSGALSMTSCPASLDQASTHPAFPTSGA